MNIILQNIHWNLIIILLLPLEFITKIYKDLKQTYKIS